MKKRKLSLKQKKFCELYATSETFFGNGVQAYIEAYDYDIDSKRAYNVARVNASNLLTKPNILNEIDSLLENEGLNDQYVDKQLLFLIRQQADLRVKRGAISEYNKLKQRITDKIDLTSKGEKLTEREDSSYSEFLKKRNKSKE